MIQLASNDSCTGCGACAFKCPKKCIAMKENPIGVILPEIDKAKCIECHSCEKVCPILNPVDYHEPMQAYAAWSTDEEERRTSASGGVAIEAYKVAVRDNMMAVGAVINDDFTVTMQMTDSMQGLKPFKNSKYVFSSLYDIYPVIKAELKNGRKIIVIGLPCQIAAIRKTFRENENLLLIDVVCHGTTPYNYLRQHISKIEKILGKKAVKMSFRDAILSTHKYFFTLYTLNNERFYSQRTKDGDTYQIGYHRMISYRENCYHCRFARDKRISDVTLSDYKGLGKLAPCDFNELKVSSILVNTEKGKQFIDKLINEKRIFAESRPVREPIMGDAQLRRPSLKSKPRYDFEKYIQLYNNDFEKTMNMVIARNKRRQNISYVIHLPLRAAKKILKIVLNKK